MRRIKCAYSECMLPSNNARYFVQLCYLILSILFLFKSSNEFTFFSIFMYSVPVLIDLLFCTMQGKIFTTIKYCFIVFNAVIILFCLLGLIGGLKDTGAEFQVVETSLILASLKIQKTKFIVPMLLELIVPCSLFFGSPNQRSMHIVESTIKT